MWKVVTGSNYPYQKKTFKQSDVNWDKIKYSKSIQDLSDWVFLVTHLKQQYFKQVRNNGVLKSMSFRIQSTTYLFQTDLQLETLNTQTSNISEHMGTGIF